MTRHPNKDTMREITFPECIQSTVSLNCEDRTQETFLTVINLNKIIFILGHRGFL